MPFSTRLINTFVGFIAAVDQEQDAAFVLNNWAAALLFDGAENACA